MAGVPFEPVARLATTATAAAARELLVRQAEFARARTEVEHLLYRRGHGLSEELFRAWRKAIRAGQCRRRRIRPRARSPSAGNALPIWPRRKHSSIRRCGRNSTPRAGHFSPPPNVFLPPYLVFVAEGLRERLSKQSSHESGPLPPRRKEDRAHERHLLLYLQRVCAKNDSLSEFGPEGWGPSKEKLRGLKLAPLPGIAERETFLERWTAHGVAAALNADPAVRAELSPRLHPNGRIDGNQFVFTDTAETVRARSENRSRFSVVVTGRRRRIRLGTRSTRSKSSRRET